MSITLGPNGFESSTTDLKVKISSTTVVEDHRLAGGTVNSTQPMPVKSYKPSWGGYPNQGHATDTIWSNYSMAHNSQNSGFDSTTGRFTAPVAGTYVLNMGGITHTPGTTNTDIRYSLMRNGNQNSAHCISSNNGGNYSPTCVSVAWYLGVGDYVECKVYANGQAHGGNWNNFSGHYAG